MSTEMKVLIAIVAVVLAIVLFFVLRYRRHSANALLRGPAEGLAQAFTMSIPLI